MSALDRLHCSDRAQKGVARIGPEAAIPQWSKWVNPGLCRGHASVCCEGSGESNASLTAGTKRASSWGVNHEK
jgi:hypothetical protein